MDTPTIKRKKGKIRSVGVQPFQLACSKGAYIFPQSPGLFTKIIAATVAPLKKSRDNNLAGASCRVGEEVISKV
ncbi:hypothetical protein D3C72_2288410 [compost metagenome]